MSVKLSVVVPCHNVVGKFTIGDGFANVNNDDLELVLVDDSSSDGTLDLLKDHAARANVSCSVVSGVFGGPGGARNVGIRSSTGDYIWMLDADDVSHPGPVLDRLGQIVADGYDVASFEFFKTGSKKRITPSFRYATVHECVQSTNRLFPLVIRKSFITDNDLWFEDNLYMLEDSLFITRLVIACESYASFEGIVCDYVDADDSLCNGTVQDTFFSKWAVIEKTLDLVNRRIPHERPLFDESLTELGLSLDWARHVESGKLAHLVKVMPYLVKLHREIGIERQFGYFLSSGSASNRAAKALAFASSYLSSFFVSSGRERIRDLYMVPGSAKTRPPHEG